MTNRVPIQNTSPKAEICTKIFDLFLFSNQPKPWFILWSNVCDFEICNLIFSNCSNSYKSKGRCSHLLCGTGWSRTSQCPKSGLADAMSLQHLVVSLGKTAPSTYATCMMVYQTSICACLLRHHSVQAMGILRQEDLWRERTGWEAAVLYSMVPSAVCDFQLENCTVVSA